MVLLRDGDAGLEVFLLRRHAASDVHGGAYVFPGGKLDGADSDSALVPHLDQPATALHASLNEPELTTPTAAGLYVAALREAFEECGVLHAAGPQQRAPDLHQAAGLLREGLGFHAMLARLQLQLQTRRILPWSRWITPSSSGNNVKRFDTRFFVAAMPPAHLTLRAVTAAWFASCASPFRSAWR